MRSGGVFGRKLPRTVSWWACAVAYQQSYVMRIDKPLAGGFDIAEVTAFLHRRRIELIVWPTGSA
jgi:hypothetical protein